MLYKIGLNAPNYSGFLEKEIEVLKMKVFGNQENWEKGLAEYDLEISEIRARKKRTDPKIGMTPEEAINSKWGRPKKVNKTTTAYGITEQWVYPENKYIYFDNGKLTAIQE